MSYTSKHYVSRQEQWRLDDQARQGKAGSVKVISFTEAAARQAALGAPAGDDGPEAA